jgi:predicted nucleic acid-binding protein
VILVDTSVWVDHLRQDEPELRRLLERGQVVCHPFVIGELAMGSMKNRNAILGSLSDLPTAEIARDEEVLHFVSAHALFGYGIGYVDAHLLAATQLTSGSSIWTHDRRLQEIATKLSLSMEPRSSIT